MTDDDPLDLHAVAADDAAVERLRAGAPAGDDEVLAMLRDLLADVETDLPAEPPVPLRPVGRGSTVLALAGEGAPEKRIARGGTVVAVLTAGLVSLGGVAAASTLVPQGGPLHGLGEAVRSAAGAVVGAVTPPETAGRAPAVAATPSATPTAQPASPRPATPGAAVSAEARSLAAARQVDQLLDQAEALLADGRTKTAVARLDLAQRRLAEVLSVHRADLAERLAALRDRATAVPAKPAKPTKPAEPAKPAKPEQKPAQQAEQQPAQQPEPKKAEPKAKSGSRSGGGGKGGAPTLGHSVSDASAKPRA